MSNPTRLVSKLLGTAALGGLLALSACETNRTSLFIRGVISPDVDTATGACTFDAQTDAYLLSGTVDVGLTSGFTLDLAVANQMLARANRLQVAAEVNRVTISRAEVRISSATALRRDRFSTLVTGIVNPGDGTNPGVGVVSVNVLQPDVADGLLTELQASGGTADLVAYVKLFGETLGGNDIETDFFQYPFTACAGCLVRFPAPEDGVVNCESTSGITAVPCRVGQNVPVLCPLCKGNPYCDPAVLNEAP